VYSSFISSAHVRTKDGKNISSAITRIHTDAQALNTNVSPCPSMLDYLGCVPVYSNQTTRSNLKSVWLINSNQSLTCFLRCLIRFKSSFCSSVSLSSSMSEAMSSAWAFCKVVGRSGCVWCECVRMCVCEYVCEHLCVSRS